VRESPAPISKEPPLSGDDDATQPSAQAAEPVLTPQVARASLASAEGARVAELVGQAQAFAPRTFVELLDASLSL
jgi:hypothetical protein